MKEMEMTGNRLVLGRKLSEKALSFLREKEEQIGTVEFRDISIHPDPCARSLDGCHDVDGAKHIVWLKPSIPNFEHAIMHELMHGVLIHEGFPLTCRPRGLADDILMHNIGSLLTSAITDPIIDNLLMKSGLVSLNRDSAVERQISDAWSDSKSGNAIPYNHLFCKWTLITVLLGLDETFNGNQKTNLHSYLSKKFPAPVTLGNQLSEEIMVKGFQQPSEALSAMILLRNSLKLNGRVVIVDSNNDSW